MQTDSVFLIPTYNEKPIVLLSILEEILSSTDSDIYLYNDGSKMYDIERFLNIYMSTLCNNRIKVFNNKKNFGQGYALRYLTKQALKEKYKYYITLDSDGQHRVEDAKKLLSYIMRKDIDIVLGKRNINSNQIPSQRRLLLRFGGYILNKIFNLKFEDPQNGMRVFNEYVAKEIISNIIINRFGHSTEILDRISNNKDLRYEELDIEVIYNKYTISKGQKNINIFNILKEYLYYKFISNRLNIAIYKYLHIVFKIV